MSSAAFADHLAIGARHVGADISPAEVEQFASYYELLRRWNRTINLTALPLDSYPPRTLDRLLVEPLVAARFIENGPTACVDLGSGGGSPAIPMKILRPRMKLTMVESRQRKAAFLQEATRQLGLSDVEVLAQRVEELPSDLAGLADVVTVRAVRLEAALVDHIGRLLMPGGRLFLFGDAEMVAGFDLQTRAPLPGTSSLGVFQLRQKA